MPDLSILVPARSEMFLGNTIDDILAHAEGDTEVICVLDGEWPLEPLPDHPKVTLIYHAESVGQRAATNDAAKLSGARYVMKCDAHCSFDQGFDVKMMADMRPDWTMVPRMKNLHVFDWLCRGCGHRQYQGPTPDGCPDCGGEMERDVLWRAKPNPDTTSMRFDRDLKFQYWRAYKKRQEGDLVDTMSILGACWMLERERYFELDICDEGHGSWGQQGTEVACKTWLSGGRLVVNKRTWFAHMFRTQGKDFGFPYPLSGRDVRKARNYSQDIWQADSPPEMPKWDKAVYSLQWLIDRFAPVPDWEERTMEDGDTEGNVEGYVDDSGGLSAQGARVVSTVDEGSVGYTIPQVQEVRSLGDTIGKGIVYYTDNRLDPAIMDACQKQLQKAGLPIVSVGLQPLNGFGQNITLDAERGPLTMFQQILAGLEACEADVVFFAEHDVLYHPSHFEFTPERADLFYYNNNMWKVDVETGRALFHYSNHTSQLCAHRDLLLEHYRRRVEMVEQGGFSNKIGYEPGTHGRAERVDDYKCETWMSEQPNVDIRHKHNLTPTRWKREQFRNQRYTKGWTEADEVPGWGQVGRLLAS